jgi:hypothetical protein
LSYPFAFSQEICQGLLLKTFVFLPRKLSLVVVLGGFLPCIATIMATLPTLSIAVSIRNTLPGPITTAVPTPAPVSTSTSLAISVSFALSFTLSILAFLTATLPAPLMVTITLLPPLPALLISLLVLLTFLGAPSVTSRLVGLAPFVLLVLLDLPFKLALLLVNVPQLFADFLTLPDARRRLGRILGVCLGAAQALLLSCFVANLSPAQLANVLLDNVVVY